MGALKSILWQLEAQIKNEEAQKFWKKLKRKYATLNQFEGFDDLRKFLHQKDNQDYKLKDNIILTLLSEYQTTIYKSLFSPFLLLLFEPAIKSIYYLYRKRISWYPEIEDYDLVSLIISFFLEQFEQPLLEGKVFSRISGRIKNKIRSYFNKLIKEDRTKAELQNLPDYYLDNNREEGFLAPALSKDEIIKLLDKLEKQKIITPLQKHIIIGSFLYQKSAAELAKSFNLTPENVRQIKSRGVRKIKLQIKK
ncbi:sigma-70 family RNA polymerase sigma factor [Candidatus Calescamantes bacterium]|nr:sigma-70 family RNA polymerase sigma factor [Candidatus Calescamantes bacterium]